MKEISICIPTYKRRAFLEQALSPMLDEVTKYKLESFFEIVIFNDNGHDETDTFIRTLLHKYPFITYVMQKKRRGLRKAIEYLPEVACGKYIWFFSDDDVPVKGSLKYMLELVQQKKPGIIFGNVDDFNGEKITSPNMLRMDKDMELSTRKDFFRFLSTKFGRITYFTSYISNFIIRRELYEKYSDINAKYDSEFNMTPLVTPFLYSKMVCPIIITKKPIVLRRTGNESWADPDPIAQTLRSYKISGFHFGNIQWLNFWDIPFVLHLYFIAHTVERTLIASVIQIPFGLQLIRLYWSLEKKIYSVVFSK